MNKKKNSPKTIIKKYRVTIFSSIVLLIAFFSLWYNNLLRQEVKIVSGIDYTNQDKIKFQQQVNALVKGHPIEEMVPYIVQEDNKIAAFIISIAKKESNWGKRVPHLNGEDCFNYWGYRGGGERVAAGGYTCFDSREEAVRVIAARISELVNINELNTPEEMIIWKCGTSCAGHSNEGVNKWISDVSYYFNKVLKK